MTEKKFDEFMSGEDEHNKSLMKAKATEYSSNSNRFHNFEVAHHMFGLIIDKDSPYFPYYTNFCKQFTGIIDIINGKSYDPQILREKFGDCKNYLTLLHAKLFEDFHNKIISSYSIDVNTGEVINDTMTKD